MLMVFIELSFKFQAASGSFHSPSLDVWRPASSLQSRASYCRIFRTTLIFVWPTLFQNRDGPRGSLLTVDRFRELVPRATLSTS